MEFPTSWSLDSQFSKMEKMESGINARPIDYANFGCPYLRNGNWNGKHIISESWKTIPTTSDSNAMWNNYKCLWWMSRKNKGRYLAAGNLTHSIFIAPDKNCVILRFGRGKPGSWKIIYPHLFHRIADAL